MPTRPNDTVSRWERRLVRLMLAVGRLEREPSGQGRARGVLRIIQFTDRVEERFRDIRRLRPDGVVRYDIARLPCADLPVPGQPPVRRRERVVALHWDNQVIAGLVTDEHATQALTWQLARVVVKDFKALADLARAGALPPDVRVAWVETVIYPVLDRFGFATRPAPRSLRRPFIRLYQISMIAIYGRDGLVRLQDSDNLRLGDAWISLDELMRRY